MRIKFMMLKIKNLLNGLWDNLKFTNGLSIVWQRFLFRSERFTAYRWKERWWLICDRNYMDDHSPKEVLARGVYDEAILASSSGKPFSYVNVGANVGAFDIAVASLISRVEQGVCFELNPRTSGRLRFNLEANGLGHIVLRENGIASKGGTISIRETGCGHNFGLYSESDQSAGEVVICRLTSLSDALEEFPRSDGWDLLKLDCEGAEYEILSTQSGYLRNFAFIVLEVHPAPSGYTELDIEKAFATAGFVQVPLGPPAPSALKFYKRV